MPIYTKEEQYVLIKMNPFNLRIIDNQYEEICLEAVKNDGRVLKYAENQTPEICLAAVKEYGHSLEYVENQTLEICLAAVKTNGYSIGYVKNQTPELCLAAVKTNGRALEEVEEQTPEICFYAFLDNNSVYTYFKDKIDNLIESNLDITNNTFCIRYYKDIINKDYSYFDMDSFLFMKNLLIHKNTKNRYIFRDSIDIELLKELSLSNNELILVNTGNIKSIHKKLANKIITIEELEKESF